MSVAKRSVFRLPSHNKSVKKSIKLPSLKELPAVDPTTVEEYMGVLLSNLSKENRLKLSKFEKFISIKKGPRPHIFKKDDFKNILLKKKNALKHVLNKIGIVIDVPKGFDEDKYYFRFCTSVFELYFLEIVHGEKSSSNIVPVMQGGNITIRLMRAALLGILSFFIFAYSFGFAEDYVIDRYDIDHTRLIQQTLYRIVGNALVREYPFNPSLFPMLPMEGQLTLIGIEAILAGIGSACIWFAIMILGASNDVESDEYWHSFMFGVPTILYNIGTNVTVRNALLSGWQNAQQRNQRTLAAPADAATAMLSSGRSAITSYIAGNNISEICGVAAKTAQDTLASNEQEHKKQREEFATLMKKIISENRSVEELDPIEEAAKLSGNSSLIALIEEGRARLEASRNAVQEARKSLNDACGGGFKRVRSQSPQQRDSLSTLPPAPPGYSAPSAPPSK